VVELDYKTFIRERCRSIKCALLNLQYHRKHRSRKTGIGDELTRILWRGLEACSLRRQARLNDTPSHSLHRNMALSLEHLSQHMSLVRGSSVTSVKISVHFCLSCSIH
jgi:hypothetical protein